MTGPMIFVLIFLIGGAVGLGALLAGLGVYYWGRNSGKNSKRDESN
jgi:hypothetical protein